jgi:thiol-disulfide isomerase/thioredoxin
MTNVFNATSQILVLCGTLLPGTALISADRSAEQILGEFDGLQVPAIEAARTGDQEYVRDITAKRAAVFKRQDDLALEIYKVAPRHRRIPNVMAKRWAHRTYPPDKNLECLKEIDEVLARDNNAELRIEGIYVKAVARLRLSRASRAPELSDAEEFMKLAPQDQRGAVLLDMAGRGARDQKLKATLEDRAIQQYPSSSYAQGSIRRRLSSLPDGKAKQALEDRVLRELRGTRIADEILGERHLHASLGKPLELEFVDAIEGSRVSIKGLKGKVVVIDFWATWCAPCVADIPHLKELHAKYHEQGVEFIGVSLDDPVDKGGLARLKKFVKDRGINWPQYYQGDRGDGGFSRYWGIQTIPVVFVLDADGNLYSADAQGKLDTVLPELLKRRNAVDSGKRVLRGE